MAEIDNRILLQIKRRLDEIDKRVDDLEDRVNENMTKVFQQIIAGNTSMMDMLSINTKETNKITGEVSRIKDQLRQFSEWQPIYQDAFQSHDKKAIDQKIKKVVTLLDQHFSDTDLTELIFKASLGDEDITGETKYIRAKNIVDYAKKRSMLNRLVFTAAQERPSIKWPFGTDWLRRDEEQ